MGNLLQACIDPKGEAKKRSAFEGTNASSSAYGHRDKVDGATDPSNPEATGLDHLSDDKHGQNLHANNLIAQQQQQQNEKDEAERQRLFREEKARLKLIVSTADRDMVSIHPNKGLTGGDAGGGMNSHAQGAGVGSGRQVGYYDPAYAAAEAQDLLQSGGGGGGLHALFLEMEMKESALLQEEEEAKQRGKLVPAGKRSMISMVAGRVPPTALLDPPSVVEVLSKNHVWTKTNSHHHNIEVSEMMKALWNWRRQLQLDDPSPDVVNSVASCNTSSSGIVPNLNADSAPATGGNLKFYFDDCAEKFVGSILPTKETLFQGLGPIVENLP